MFNIIIHQQNLNQNQTRKRLLGGWGSRKSQESVPPLRQQLYWQNLSDANYLELWILLWRPANHRRRLDGKLQLISVHFSSKQSSSDPSLISSHVADRIQLYRCSWSSLQKSGWAKRTLSSKYLPWSLIVASSHQRCRQRGGQPLLSHLPPSLQVPSALAEVTSRVLKGLELFHPPLRFLPFPFR